MKFFKTLFILFPLFVLSQNKKIKIGDFYQGGIVFHVVNDSNNVQHGLIVSIKDIAKEVTWSNVSMELVDENLNYENDGEINTKAIINQKNHKTSAAFLCSQYKYKNSVNWYLPTIEEFKKIFVNKDVIEKAILLQKGDLMNNKLYWTSNEYMYGFAWVFPYYFSSKQSYEVDKINLYPVRAVKKF